eukprot:EG_transcript_2472
MALGSHDLNLYCACAKEFYETGIVKSNCHGFDGTKCSIHITLILATIVICASIATGVTPLTILSIRLTNEIDDLATKLALQVTEAVVEQLALLTQPCPALCDVVHRMFRSGLLSSHLQGGLESPEAQALFTFLWEMLGVSKGAGVPVLYVGTEYSAEFTYERHGNSYVLWNRTSPFKLATTPGGPVSVNNESSIPDATSWWSPRPGQINASNGWLDFVNPYDPRKRPWYVMAKARGPNFKGWSEPYVFFDGMTLGFTAVQSLRNATGGFMGVVGCDITLKGLVDFLTSDKMRLSPNMRHTVIETSGLIIGSSVPGVLPIHKSAAGEDARLSVLDARQPDKLQAVVRALQPAGRVAAINTEGKLLALEGMYVYATPLRDEFNMDCIYIMYVPTTDFLGHAVATTTLCVGTCVGIILAITLAALWAAWDLSTRMRMLAADMRRATSLNLGSIRTRGTSSRIREVQAISREFCKLVNALRSFQKYLPQAQVGFLLSSNLEANLAAIQHEVTVMFLDIENFTELVESFNDTGVIQFYGDIMTVLTHKVLQAQGTLDKNTLATPSWRSGTCPAAWPGTRSGRWRRPSPAGLSSRSCARKAGSLSSASALTLAFVRLVISDHRRGSITLQLAIVSMWRRGWSRFAKRTMLECWFLAPRTLVSTPTCS